MNTDTQETFRKINQAATDIHTGKNIPCSLAIFRGKGLYTIHTVNLADYNGSREEAREALRAKYGPRRSK